MTSDQATVGAFLVVALGSLAASARWVWPRLARFFRSLDTMFETINGRPAELDRAGRVVSQPVPSLGVQISDLRQAVADQANQDARITAVEEAVTDLGKRVTAMESGHQIERIVTRAESAQAWKAVEAIATQPEDK